MSSHKIHNIRSAPPTCFYMPIDFPGSGHSLPTSFPCHFRIPPETYLSLSFSVFPPSSSGPVGVSLPLSSSGLTRRSRKREVLIILCAPAFWIMRYAYPLTPFGAACRRCLRPPFSRDCANKKLPVASFHASPFTLLKTRTTLCPPFEIRWN